MYVPLTHLERWIPLAFSVLYVGLAAYALFAPVDRKELTPQSSASIPNAQAHTFKTNKDWVKAARNWGWSGLSSWSDESILRNLSTAVGFRAGFPEYGTWDDEQISYIAVRESITQCGRDSEYHSQCQ
jgi:hypothetical protein